MTTLALTFNGPFAYIDQYPERGYITLMAPMCGQHKAGISGIDPGNEYILAGNGCNHPSGLGGLSAKKYELRIDPGQAPSGTWSGPTLECPTPANGYEPKEWRFWLQLPRPDVFVASNPVHAQIIDPDQTLPQAAADYAVGVRFLYLNWVRTPIPLWLNGQPVSKPGGSLSTNPMQFEFVDHGDDYADLDIEYSGPVRDDPEHEDAVKCFENLMDGLGLPWSIYFVPSQLLSTRHNDCKAAIAVVKSS
jgi:hypothetical protein